MPLLAGRLCGCAGRLIAVHRRFARERGSGPIGHGMGEADGECEGMGCERERIRASELKRERERGTRIVLQLHGELCVVLSGTCRMHACSSMTDLHSGDAKQPEDLLQYRVTESHTSDVCRHVGSVT